MKSFGIFRLDGPPAKHVQPTGEFSDKDRLLNLGVYGASGGAYGTIADLWKFDHALLELAASSRPISRADVGEQPRRMASTASSVDLSGAAQGLREARPHRRASRTCRRNRAAQLPASRKRPRLIMFSRHRPDQSRRSVGEAKASPSTCFRRWRADEAAPRRQHRPRRDHPERARRRSSRSGARGDHGGQGRRRRNHRASARRPAPHHRRRHRPADGRDRPAAEPGDGGDRGDAGDRAAPPPACRLHRPREARGAHDRGRARRRRPAQPLAYYRRQARRRQHPRQPVHRAEPSARSKPRFGSARRSSSSTPAAMPTPRARSARPN